jgi:phosphoglycerate dehydrogenase-like enzyme
MAPSEIRTSVTCEVESLSATAALRLAIAVPLQEELVDSIRDTDPQLGILYEPELLPPTRYPNDHAGVPGFSRTEDDERRWREMLACADILFGIPGDSPDGLREVIRANDRLRWIQATAAGAGEQVHAAALTAEERERVLITSASGVHAVPLAEFCLFALLAFTKQLPRLLRDQRDRRWEHYPFRELRGQRLLILGMGSIGAEVARLGRSFGMCVTGVTRSGHSGSDDAQRIYGVDKLDDVLPQADAIVIALPLTSQTEGLIDAKRIRAIKRGATLVNIGRGRILDEPALIQALRDGHLAGAALDVFATEPLPANSPLWELPNVLITPHTAALSTRENERIVELFTENLRRFRAGQELLSRVDPEHLY